MSEVARSSSSLARTNKKSSLKKKTTSSQSIRLNWKVALKLSYVLDSIKEINRDRLWSELVNTQRKKCPETTWLSLYTIGSNELDPKLIAKTQMWIEAMTASPSWPFPKEVILQIAHKRSTNIQILIKNDASPLPFVEIPDGIMAIRVKSKYYSGWEVILENTQSQFKAGNA